MLKKCIIVFILASAFLLSAKEKEPNNLIIINSGADKAAEVRTAKSIQVFVTFENTKIWSDDKSLDDYLAGKENDTAKAAEKKAKMIAKFYKIFDAKAKSQGKKWSLSRIEDKSAASGDYLIVLNYDKAVPITGVGAQGYATVTIYKGSELIITGTLKAISIAKSPADLNPNYQFSELAQRYVGEIVDFLKGADDKKQ